VNRSTGWLNAVRHAYAWRTDRDHMYFLQALNAL